MMFNKKISLTSAILFAAATAFAEGESVEQQQSSLLQKLDSLNEAVLGLKLNGTLKAGGLTSTAKSDQFSDNSPTQENQGYTDANLVLTARPSSETQATIKLRLHKDWQSAFDENNNPVIGHWFSYDGSILNKHLDFNLGYMRVGYTPYTLYTPQQMLLQEPDIFAEKRVEALELRNLDTTSRRLMQGLNVDYHSGNVGPLSDIHAQATGARLRNAAKKTDQVFFDFDWTDRYFYGLRLGADAFGAHLGVNYTDVFDRIKASRARDIDLEDSVYYEDNSVLSIEAGFDSKELLSNSVFGFGLNGEFAMSNLEQSFDHMISGSNRTYQITEYQAIYDPVLVSQGRGDTIVIVKINDEATNEIASEDLGKIDGMSFYVEPYVTLDVAGIDANLKVMYMQNNEKFWSEMASSPAYRGNTVILNANALYKDGAENLINQFGMSSLENMYFSVYNSNPLQAGNLMTSASKNALSNEKESGNMYYRLYNNYKNAHFYRNGYNADVLKNRELADAEKALFLLDPANDMALPLGVATPDRKGLNVNLDLSWNEAVELNAFFGMISTVSSEIEENKFTRYAAGLGVDVGRIAGLDRKIKIQGSYDHSEEDKGYQRKNDRIMAGLNVDVFGPVAFLAGYQTSTREFGQPLFGIMSKAQESLLLIGPRVKIAPNSYLSIQYGLLTDKLSYSAVETQVSTITNQVLGDDGLPAVDPATGMPVVETQEVSQEVVVNKTLSIDKNIISADVTVNF